MIFVAAVQHFILRCEAEIEGVCSTFVGLDLKNPSLGLISMHFSACCGRETGLTAPRH
jgi:hypothetical protein